MAKHSMPVDRTGRVVIRPAIRRLYPGTDRAWHGGRVTVFIETAWVPDGTEVRFEVVQAGDQAALLELDATATIDKGRGKVDWAIDLSEDNVDHPLAIHDGAHEVIFVAHIEELGGLSARSTPLYVDLTPFVISF